jgi:1-pyrroline-5-carboxylate dehydrogenase
MSFKLTYSTMFNPPAEMHERFEAALTKLKAGLGTTYAFHIGGAEVKGSKYDTRKSPIDQRMVLGQFPVATAEEATRAMDAAHAAFPVWRATPVAERVRLMRRAAALIEERVYDIAAALCLEVGKNRMEALADAQETADFFALYAEDFLKHNSFDHKLPDDPSSEFRAHNRSIAKPYGAWLVIAPYNFPFALGGGPVAAALITGNTVVLKGATDTPWAGRLLADVLRDAGFPSGVFNYVSGGGSVAGEALIAHPELAGVTFTGSYDVGMHIFRKLASGRYPRPCITEMGGKNACIVTANADLECAASGIIRSAYGLSGQKCSATSRLYVDAKVADALADKLLQKIGAFKVGDPSKKENWMGPVTTAGAYANYQRYSERLRDGGKVLTGAEVLRDGDLGNGFFVAPTFAEAPATHPLFDEEMFSPILMLCRVRDREEAMRLTNASALGLTAGCFGNDDDVDYFFNNVEAGVTYANRAQGATTGAWPGYQPFGGWKGSSSSGKGIASFYYLAQYLREQSQTRVE